MSWKEFIKDYLTFSRKDRVAILILAGLVVVALLIPAFLSKKHSNQHQPSTDTTWMAAARKLEQRQEPNSYQGRSSNAEENSSYYQYDPSARNEKSYLNGQLFEFDPNTISFGEWKKLGLRDKTIQTIQNYLAKGGHFKKPDDLQKIYGLHPDEFTRLAPYIRIESSPIKPETPNSSAATTNKEVSNSARQSFSKYSIIDINAADTTAFIALPGIGSKLASRIVNFRDKLGGFYSVSQVAETFGLPDSTFQKIKQYLTTGNNQVKKININTATIDELKAHPYIRYSLANPIVAYRKEHGSFSKIDDIKNIMAVTEEVFTKISPYLSVQ